MSSFDTIEGENAATARKWRNFWLLLLVAAVPMLIPYFYEMWGVQWYQYFPFLIIAVMALAYSRSDHRFYPPRGWLHWLMVSGGLLLLVASAVLQFTWFAALGFFLIGASCLAVMRGPRDASLIALAVPLAMLVQLPLRTDKMLVVQLQRVTTWLSSVMLDAAAAPHAVAGNVIQLAKKELFVAEACSGIQSVFTLACLACLLVAYKRRRIWLTPFYLAIAALLAVAANVIRVTTVALAEVWYELDLTTGWPHEIVGYIALGISVLFLLSFDQLMVTMLHSVSEIPSFNPLISLWNRLALRDEEGNEVEFGDTAETIQLVSQREQSSSMVQLVAKLANNPAVGYAFIAATALIATFSIAQVVRSRKPDTYATSAKSVVFQPPSNLVEGSLQFLRVVGHETTRGYSNPRLGANSDIWTCEADNMTAQLVLSQPHTGWHELCDCYERLDWLLVNRLMQSPSADIEANPVPYVVARFKRGDQFGYLLFAGIGSDGSLVPAPSSLSAFTHRVWNRIDTTGVWEQNEVIMLQLWVVASRKLESQTLKSLENDFAGIRSKIAREIREQRNSPNDSQLTNTDRTVDAVAFQSPVARKEE